MLSHDCRSCDKRRNNSPADLRLLSEARAYSRHPGRVLRGSIQSDSPRLARDSVATCATTTSRLFTCRHLGAMFSFQRGRLEASSASPRPSGSRWWSAYRATARLVHDSRSAEARPCYTPVSHPGEGVRTVHWVVDCHHSTPMGGVCQHPISMFLSLNIQKSPESLVAQGFPGFKKFFRAFSFVFK